MKQRTVVFLVILFAFTLVYGSLAFYIASPRPSQHFIGWGVYSENGLLSQYISGSNNTVQTNQTLNWHFEIANRMGVVQFIRIVTRIGNLTTATPTTSQPADVPAVEVEEKFISNGETSRVNFSWRVVFAPPAQTMYPVFEINGQTVASPVGATSGRDFRLIFELWTFDPSTGSFQYGWSDGGSRVGSWLQIAFNIASQT